MSDPINTAYAFFQLNPVQAGPPVLYNGETTLPNTAFVSRELPLNSIYRNPTGGQLTGSFLVRQVPEPPIYTLLLAALSAFGLVAHGRRRVEGVSQSVVGAQFH